MSKDTRGGGGVKAVNKKTKFERLLNPWGYPICSNQKKFKIPVVPIFIERFDEIKFNITVNKPIYFSQDSSIHIITEKLNKILEKMILKKPEQWIWSHNRWK